MHRQRLLVAPVFMLVVAALFSGCWPGDVGVTIVANPQVLDFGRGDVTKILRVSRNFSLTPLSTPLVVTSNADWVVPGACADNDDGCFVRGALTNVRIPVTIRRDRLALGTNRAKLYLNAGPASRVEVDVLADDTLHADFFADQQQVAIGRPVVFRDASATTDAAGAVTSWLWEFGDGTVSNEQNPSHLYLEGGTYDVSLTVQAGGARETVRKQGFVRVSSGAITVDFAASRTNIAVNGTVNFTDLSVSGNTPVTSWLWEFGDGGTSTDPNPYHQYNASGLYSVTLTVNTLFGSAFATKPNFIIVSQKVGPEANFAASELAPYLNQPVRFTDLSYPGSAPVTNWLWEFGDGTTSREQSPVHAFAAVGVYNVKLTVYTRDGTSSFSKPLTVGYKAPKAQFVADTLAPFVNELVRFTDLSEPGSAAVVKWEWDFGDGTVSVLQSPAHRYARAGKYTVRLKVTSADPSNNTNETVKTDYIAVAVPPAPDFTWTPNFVLAGSRVQFSAAATIPGTDPIISYTWDFDGDPGTTGDVAVGANVSYTFPNPELYRPTLTVSTASRSVSVTKNIRVDRAPNPDFTAVPTEGIIGDAIQFNGVVQPLDARPIAGWLWRFGDGETSTEQSPAHQYAGEGAYKVSLTLFFRHSTAVAADPDLSVVREKTNYVKIVKPVPPAAEFSSDTACAITGAPVTFAVDAFSSPSKPITEWRWNFGDGSPELVLADPDPVSHTFETAGDFQVTLTVTAAALDPEVGVRAFTLPTGPLNVVLATPLDEYVRLDDGAYDFQLRYTFPIRQSGVTLATVYSVYMTSQQWRTSADIYSGLAWTHPLIIIEPAQRVSSTGMIFVDGGSRSSQPPSSAAQVDEFLWQLAVLSGTPIAVLKNVPSQPIVFTDEVTPGDADEEDLILRSRTEDSIIAYSYNKYMESVVNGTPDTTWPLLFPMAKAAVKAMDTVQTLMGDPLYGVNKPVNDFVVAGASKRGWTTWLTGVADCRVKAIAPIVIDVLNMGKHLDHHRKAYGYWAPAIYDYAQANVFDRLIPDSNGDVLPEAEATLKLVDPYQYAMAGRLYKPKFMMNGTMDQFFVPDASQWYYGDLEGEKYLNYIPNGDHGLVGAGQEIDPTASDNPAGNLLGWYMSVTQNKTRPQFDWSFQPDGSIRVAVNAARRPKAVRLWHATAVGARDFRNGGTTGNPVWTSLTLSPTAPNGTVYSASRPVPAEGSYTAFLVQLVYDNTAQLPSFVSGLPGLNLTVPDLVFTTGVQMLPREADGSNKYPEFNGYLANADRPDAVAFPEAAAPVVVLYGSPEKMGRDYGQLRAAQINQFIPAFVQSYLDEGKATEAALLADWDNQAAQMDPRIVQEIDGIAAGSGLNPNTLHMAHVLAAMDVSESVYTSSAAVGAWRARSQLGTTVHAATVNGPLNRVLNTSVGQRRMSDYDTVVVYIPDRGVPHAVMTYAGLAVGRTGVNLSGVSLSEAALAGAAGYAPENLNFQFLFRETLYGALSLREALDTLTAYPPQLPGQFFVADGRNERRGAVITFAAPDAEPEVRFNFSGDFTANSPRTSGMFYGAKDAATTTIYRGKVNTSFAVLNETTLMALAKDPAVATADNLLNVVYSSWEGQVLLNFATAAGASPASTQSYVAFDMQQLLP